MTTPQDPGVPEPDVHPADDPMSHPVPAPDPAAPEGPGVDPDRG